MNKKIRDLLFVLILIGSAFRIAPILFYHPALGLIGGSFGFGTKLMIIPLILGMLYTLYCYIVKKDKDVLVFSKKAAIFACFYLGVMYISFAWGLWNFPFLDQAAHGVHDFGQMGKVQTILSIIGISLPKESLILVMMAIRTAKNIIIDFIWQFGGVYLIYCWYRKEPERLIKMVALGVTFLVIIEIINTALEWLYLAGNLWAKHVLEIITPFFHPVNLPYHPTSSRVLWPGQIRGTFTEPSYFGMFCAFALPFLWYQLIACENKRTKAVYGILTLVMAFNIFITSSRTALGLFLVEILMLVLVGLYIHKKKLLIMVGIAIALNLFGLGAGNYYMSHIMAPNMVNLITFGIYSPKPSKSNQPQAKPGKSNQPQAKPGKSNQPQTKPGKSNQPQAKPGKSNQPHTTLHDYIDRNLMSLTDINKRSNRSRFTIAITHIRIGLDHPVLGVGFALRQPYVGKYLKGQKLNPEINRWQDAQKRLGIWVESFPNLGEYWVRFAEGGILGLLAYLVIPIILVIRLVKIVLHKKSLIYGIVLTSLIGCMGIGLGDTMTILYVYWLILGVGFALTASSESSNDVGKDNSDAPM